MAPLPCHILGQALGLPPAPREHFVLWTRRPVPSLGEAQTAVRGSANPRCQEPAQEPDASTHPHGMAVEDRGSSLVWMAQPAGGQRLSPGPFGLLLPTPISKSGICPFGDGATQLPTVPLLPSLVPFPRWSPLFLKFRGREAEVLTTCTAAHEIPQYKARRNALHIGRPPRKWLLAKKSFPWRGR